MIHEIRPSSFELDASGCSAELSEDAGVAGAFPPIVWDEDTGREQQAIEYVQTQLIIPQSSVRLRKKLRLSRIEDECSRLRRPARIKSSLRPVLRMINSCPPCPGASPKDVKTIQERFDWLEKDNDRNEVFCTVCVERVKEAPHILQCRKVDIRWELLSPRGRTITPKIELHAFSNLHTWSVACCPRVIKHEIPSN